LADGVRDVHAPDESRVTEQGLRLYAQARNGLNNGISFRFRHDLLADLTVRRALIAAIDREEVVDEHFTPNYPPATGLLATAATRSWPISPSGGRASPPPTVRGLSTSSSPRTIRWPPVCRPRAQWDTRTSRGPGSTIPTGPRPCSTRPAGPNATTQATASRTDRCSH